MRKKKKPSDLFTLEDSFHIDDSFSIPPDIQAMSYEEKMAEIKKYEEEYAQERIKKEKVKQKNSKP